MSCIPCPVGHAAETYGSTRCAGCPMDTYAPETGTKACLPCPHLTTTSQVNSTSCDVTLFAPVYAPPPPVYVENWADKLPIPLWMLGAGIAAVLAGLIAVAQCRAAARKLSMRRRMKLQQTDRAKQRGNKYELGQFSQDALLQLKRYKSYRMTPPLMRMWDVRAMVGQTQDVMGGVRDDGAEPGRQTGASAANV